MEERKGRKKGGREEEKGKEKGENLRMVTWKPWPAATLAALQPVLSVHKRCTDTGWRWIPPPTNAPTLPLHPQLHYWLKNQRHCGIHLAVTSPLWVGFKANEHCTQILLSSVTIPFCLHPDLGSHPFLQPWNPRTPRLHLPPSLFPATGSQWPPIL